MATQPDMLQDEIARRTGQGWVLVLRDAAEAQMRKPKRFSILWFLAWTFLSFGTLFWVYLIWHWAKSEQLIFLRVVEGQLVVTGGGRGVFGAPVAAYWRWAGQRESTQGKVIAYGGPVVAVIVLIIIISVASATGGGGDGDGEQVAGQPTATAPTAAPVSYDIAERKDVSFGATIRIVYTVSVSGPLTEDDIRRIAQEIIDDETSGQAVNAIGFFFYLPGTDVGGTYSAGRADWAPAGDWASADTVRAGDYSRHELGAIHVGGALGEVGKSEETTGLSEEQRRTIFKELVAAEDRADAEAEAIYPLDIFDPNYQEGTIEKYVALSNELLDKYRAEVRAKYGITEEQQSAIIVEGVTEYWPME